MKVFAPFASDFYKTGHYRQYPKNAEYVYANLTPRSGKHAPEGTIDKEHVVVSGVREMISVYLSSWREFFKMPKCMAVDRVMRRFQYALGPDAVGRQHWEDLHDLGYLPLRVKALPTGTLCPYKVPMMTLRNTHHMFPWVTLYVESAVSSVVWKCVTTATTSYNARLILNHYVEATGGSPEAARWQLHDFSFRGQGLYLEGQVSCVSHLFSSAGTDTILALEGAEIFYGADAEKELLGGGVPATEHSVMSMGIANSSELNTISDVLDEYPTGIVSVVADTKSYWNVLETILPALKPKIMARQPDALGFAKTVIRPDSGDPYRIIVGYMASEILEDFEDGTFLVQDGGTQRVVTDSEVKGSLVMLADTFGATLNQDGFLVLDPHIGLIYGDGITLESMTRILEGMKKKGFCANNVVFGLGSYTFQYVTRDSHGIALKATHCILDGVGHAVTKDPKTDDGLKKSASGLLAVHCDANGRLYLKENCTEAEEREGLLETVWLDGVELGFEYLSEVRARLGVF